MKFCLKAFFIFSVLKYEYCPLEFKSNLSTFGLKEEPILFLAAECLKDKPLLSEESKPFKTLSKLFFQESRLKKSLKELLLKAFDLKLTDFCRLSF